MNSLGKHRAALAHQLDEKLAGHGVAPRLDAVQHLVSHGLLTTFGERHVFGRRDTDSLRNNRELTAVLPVVARVDAPLRYPAVNENGQRNQDLNPYEFGSGVHLHTSARVEE